ncbi:MAG: tRNA (N6-isopentenyl adenosine(37)-C2)-methylthiotransferase MiaB [Candidatus Eremiobacteraeota bacterium]|nr:tRNA (N6-isopentenyl adenosine(37)-C2)-methylthiotransferase MiaB [Candidatus Eremiobacteraeota bacterium]
MPSVYIETFGCQMNEADSRYIADRATSAGYDVASSPEEANVVVLNTCTVRESAQRRAYGRMNHFKALKLRDPELRLVITGCLAEQDRDRMQRLSPHVDAIFGTRELARLGDQLTTWRTVLRDVAEKPSRHDARDDMLRFALGGSPDALPDPFSHLRAFVTVQRGCSYYCTFCIVPYVRGRFDHRAQNSIVEEAAARVERGAREITLVGQTVNAWRDPATAADFGDLCRAVAGLPGIERLTFISPHPKDFTEKILDDLAAIPQLNPRIHLPLQSASDAMLRRMNRKYTFAKFQEVVGKIRARFPNAAITTDIIVGFPGESDADFEATLSYASSGVFANAFTFIYSVRPGTPAARWEQVPREVALDRFSRLVDSQNRATRTYHDRKIGSVVRALMVGDSKKDRGRLTAKTPDNVTVVATKPGDYDAPGADDRHVYATTPWLDIAIETSHVWGCAGRVVGRAERFAGPAEPVRPTVVDLTAPELQSLLR